VVVDGGKLRQRVAETLELPKDVVMDIPKLSVIGNIQLNIENHRGLIHYSSQEIRVNTSIGIYKIEGSGLAIKSISSEEIIITGELENIDISS